MKAIHCLSQLSDAELLAEVTQLVRRECEATSDLVASLAEFDRRRLYLGLGYSSLFKYCVQALGLSEDATCSRIEVARAALRFPVLLERLAAGAVSLTCARLLAPHLTEENLVRLLDEARGKSKREVEAMIAAIAPKPDATALVRKLPVRGSATLAATAVDGCTDVTSGPCSTLPTGPPLAATADASGLGTPTANASAPDGDGLRETVGSEAGQSFSQAVPAHRDSEAVRNTCSAGRATPAEVNGLTSSRGRYVPPVTPLAPERYKIQMTVGGATHEKLRRAQDLLRHQVPNGDLAEVFDRALTALLERLERTKCAARTERVAAQGARRRASTSRSPRTSAATPPLASAADRPDSGERRPRRERKRAPVAAQRPVDVLAPNATPVPERVEDGVQSDRSPAVNRTSSTQPVNGSRRKPSGHSRRIPAAVKREVWKRDGGCCAFIGASGRRCCERGFLEYHHVVPYADGGAGTSDNVQLRCKAHNAHEASLYFAADE